MSRDQQTARVNVSDEEWIQFRTLAMRRRQSLAEYLGELVRGELGGASSPPQRRKPREADTGTRAPTARASSRSVRLSDRRLLTQLPKPKPPGRPDPRRRHS